MMHGYRKLQIIVQKNKWILFMFVLCSAMVVMVMRNSGTKLAEESENSYVLVNSYMQSGSTLTGIILHYREPLRCISEQLYAKWQYTNRDHTGFGELIPFICTNHCGRYPSGLIGMVTVPCADQTGRNAGPSWEQVRSCLNSFFFNSPNYCVNRYAPRLCMQAKHRVTKVLRFTTDLLGDLLRSKTDLNVLHLFRDPRAIINSRIKTSWYRTETDTKIIDSAKALCRKMFYDFKEGQKLLKLYQDRFRFIYYEDLNNDPKEKVKVLYRDLGMSLDEKMFPRAEKLTVFNPDRLASERERNTAYWWRSSLDWNIVQEMDTVCADVYMELGYKTFRNFEEYRNMSYRSAEIPNEFLIA